MIFVGIDIAKLNHFASAISSDGKVLIEPFEFSNDTYGFRLLLSRLRSLESDNIICGLESTAHYGNNLVRYLHNVVKNNATFKAYYDKKRSEGRSHYNALGHCAGKLVRIIWKMLTDNVPFNLD